MPCMRLYVIYDQVAQEGGPIFQAINDGVARRSYKAFLAQSQVEPNEYKLICVGVYNAETMHIDSFDVPLDVTKGLDEPKQMPLAEVVNE